MDVVRPAFALHQLRKRSVADRWSCEAEALQVGGRPVWDLLQQADGAELRHSCPERVPT